MTQGGSPHGLLLSWRIAESRSGGETPSSADLHHGENAAQASTGWPRIPEEAGLYDDKVTATRFRR